MSSSSYVFLCLSSRWPMSLDDVARRLMECWRHTQTIESTDTATGLAARTSRLNLIDLAGSESATGQLDRQKEGSFINKSLLTLGTVIAKLTEPRRCVPHSSF